MLSVQQALLGRNDLLVGRKIANFLLLFQSREQVVVGRGQLGRKGWVIKKKETQLGQCVLGCNCPVSQGILMQEQDYIGEFPAAFFIQNFLQLYQQR